MNLIVKFVFKGMTEVYKKQKIPKALREQLWLQKVGKKFECKCKTTWCKNKINVFDFQAGHDTPESKGGDTSISNLVPICGRCNLSMGNQFTFKEWCKKGNKEPKWNLFANNPFKQWIFTGSTENGIKSPRNPTSPKVKPRK